MFRTLPISTRTDTLFPCTTRFRSMLVEIGRRGRIGAREAGVAILRNIVVALRFAERAVEAVDGQESQAVGIDEIRHLADGHLRREQFGAFGRVDAIEAAMLRRSEEHTSELQSLMRISYAVFCLYKKNNI